MQNYSIVTVGSETFYECLREQSTEYNLNKLDSFKQVNNLFKTYNVQDGFVFLFFLNELEKKKKNGRKKNIFPKNFLSYIKRQVYFFFFFFLN